MSESLKNNFKFRFRLYYILKSTAWITPIFFLFLENQANLPIAEVLKISGMLMLLPILLDTPLGIIADRFGAKKLLVSGTLFQLFSMLAFFFLAAPYNYISYLLAIILAENSYSGAEQSFLRENIREEHEIRDFLKSTNQYFYYLTIPALIGGIWLYNVNPYFPLIIQSLSFFFAFVAIARFPVAAPHAAVEHSKTSLKENIKSVLVSKKALGYILIGIVFSGLIQINAKTIQSQIEDLKVAHLSTWLGLSYVVGNLASGSSLQLWRKSIFNTKISSRNQFIFLFALLFLTQVSTAISHAAIVCLGFVLLSGIKSIFRPLLSGELIARFKKDPRLATRLSVVSTLTTVGIALLHVLNAELLKHFDWGNLPLTLILSVQFVAGLLLIESKEPTWEPLLGLSSNSGKSHWLGLSFKKKYIKQVYPEWARLPDFAEISKTLVSQKLKFPKVIWKKDNALCVEWVEGLCLSEVSENTQKKVVQNLLSYLKESPSANTTSDEIGGTSFLHYLESLNHHGLKDALAITEYIKLTHGDLNPSNILIKDQQIYLIDWDLFGPNYHWFDTLNLLAHPELALNTQERVALLKYQLKDFSDQECRELLTCFLNYKKETVPNFPEGSIL